MSEPTTFKDVPDDVKAKARTLAVTVLNMGDVEIATGFMAGVLLHTSNTLIEEQAARIAELERQRDRYLGMLEAAENLSKALGIDTHGASVDVAVRFLKEKRAAEARLSEAVKVLESVVNEEYVPVHVGYDDGPGGGNFVYANAVRVDSDAFIKAKAFIATLGENKN